MPFDGSGNFNRVMNWVNDSLANIKIKSDRHDQEDDNFASGLSNVITKDGQTQPTNDIPLNGHKLTNVGVPTGATDAAIKSYVDAKLDFSTTGVPVPGSGAAASIRFADADIGFGTRHVDTPPGTVNRFVWNDKPDLSGTDVAVLTDVGNFSVNGTFTTTGAVTCGNIVTPVVSVKPASGNAVVYFFAPNGATARMYLYTNADAQGAGNLTVGVQNFAFGADGVFTAPAALKTGGATYQTDGNVIGTVWSPWGANDAISAINLRIEARAAAYANNCVTQMRSAGYIEVNHTTGTQGQRLTTSGYYCVMSMRVAGDQYLFGYRQIQHFVPSAGWIQSTAW
jgi:hypothetical protein